MSAVTSHFHFPWKCSWYKKFSRNRLALCGRGLNYSKLKYQGFTEVGLPLLFCWYRMPTINNHDSCANRKSAKTRAPVVQPMMQASYIMARFHRRVRVGSVRKGAVRVAFPLPKSGRDPDWAVLSRSTPPLGYWDPERVPASLSYTRRPLIGRQTRHFRATGG